MSVNLDIVEGPLGEAPVWEHAGAGAVVCFEGVVRPDEQGRCIDALDYEVYEPMTSTMLRRLAEEVVERFGLVALHVEHSFGRIRVGECSFRLRIASAHRAEALEATEQFIDRMKKHVPIWKTPAPAAEAIASAQKASSP
jgi:molybdopterin synthase catalytic subunit